jgi:hypothetical protein
MVRKYNFSLQIITACRKPRVRTGNRCKTRIVCGVTRERAALRRSAKKGPGKEIAIAGPVAAGCFQPPGGGEPNLMQASPIAMICSVRGRTYRKTFASGWGGEQYSFKAGGARDSRLATHALGAKITGSAYRALSQAASISVSGIRLPYGRGKGISPARGCQACDRVGQTLIPFARKQHRIRFTTQG